MAVVVGRGAWRWVGRGVGRRWRHDLVQQAQGAQVVELANEARTLVATVSNWGGIVQKLLVPDRSGKMADVVLGKPAMSEYLTPDASPYFGCTVGRVGNRIDKATFHLDGQMYKVDQNDGDNHLHGGFNGWDQRLWSAAGPAGPASWHLELRSPDGDAGYPGNVDATVAFNVAEDNALDMVFTATTDAPTIINMTHHGYFNLAGHDSGPVDDQLVTVHAEKYTAVHPDLIPTGQLAPVSELGLANGQPERFGAIFDHMRRVQNMPGLDHNFVASSTIHDGDLALVAEMYDPASGRHMEVWTDQPGFQVWTSNGAFSSAGKDGVTYSEHAGVCFETQNFPDAINQMDFPSAVLRPGEAYRHVVRYKFSVRT